MRRNIISFCVTMVQPICNSRNVPCGSLPRSLNIKLSKTTQSNDALAYRLMTAKPHVVSIQQKFKQK